jgi:restriction system protein
LTSPFPLVMLDCFINYNTPDGNELVKLVYQYYPQLDAKYKGLIPLRRVYIPETLAD